MVLPEPTNNPFTLVYDAMWGLVERNPELTKWVFEGNRIKYDNFMGDKKSVNVADFPELALRQEGGSFNLQNTSSTSMCMRYYSWLITTGNYAINDVYNQVSWELFRSLIEWDDKISSLKWQDYEGFVVRTNIVDIAEGTRMSEVNRGIEGWASLWTHEVEMHFNTSLLRID